MSLLYIPLCITPTSTRPFPTPWIRIYIRLNLHYLRIHSKSYNLSGLWSSRKRFLKMPTVFQRTLIISAFTKLSPLHPSMLVIQIGLVVLWQNVKQLRTEWHLKKSVEKPFLSLYLLFCLRVCDLSDLLLLSTIQLNNRYTIATLSRLSISECIQQSHI